MIVCTLTLGYSAFGTEMSIASIAADVRIEKNVRVTGVSLKSANNGSINYVEYDADSILGNVNLKSFTSTVTLQVSVTNFGNEEMGIWDITGLPDNLYKTISGYEMKTKLCDQSGSCSLGSITTFDITLGYDTYDAVTKDHEFRLDFEFRKMHKITYTGITNNNYPTSVIDGGNLTFTATRNIPPKIVAFTATGDRYDYDLYSYANNKFNFENNIVETQSFIDNFKKILEEIGIAPSDRATIIGGGAKGELWRQITADCLGMELVKTTSSDSSLGSAMLAGVAVGVFASCEDAVNACVKVESITKPIKENTEKYDKLFEEYVAVHDALAPIYQARSKR